MYISIISKKPKIKKHVIVKIIIILLLFMFSTSGMAQSLYQPRSNNKISYRNQESFKITVTQTLQRLNFQPNDRNLTDDLKSKIEHFLQNTRIRKFRKIGTIELDIIKRDTIYYIIEQRKPERIIAL